MHRQYYFTTFIALAILANPLAIADSPNKQLNGEQIIQIKLDDDFENSPDSDQQRSQVSHNKRHKERYLDQLAEENWRLRRRLNRMEHAVIQLQEAIVVLEDQLSHHLSASDFAEPMFSCILKTKRRGTFLGKGSTRIEAEANARVACEADEGKFWCKDDVTCEKVN